MKPDSNTGKVHTLITIEVFGEIRCIMSFRLTGGNKDYVVCGSDSGRICILEYIPNKNKFEKVFLFAFTLCSSFFFIKFEGASYISSKMSSIVD